MYKYPIKVTKNSANIIVSGLNFVFFGTNIDGGGVKGVNIGIEHCGERFDGGDIEDVEKIDNNDDNFEIITNIGDVNMEELLFMDD
nr:7088_t:CDS:2 [Entrophospora candida]